MFDNSIGTVPTTCLSLPNNTNIDTNIYLFIYFYALTDARKKKGGEGGGRGQEGFFGIFPLSAYSRLLLSAWKECPSRLRERFVNKKFTHTHTQGEGVFSTIVFFFLMSVAKKKNKNLVI